MRIPGEHVVSDALAAAAAGIALGVSVAKIAGALSGATGPAWRMEAGVAPGGWTVVNDAYNSNPASAAAALKALVTMGRGHRTWAVLGPMAELGAASAEQHDRLGRLAVRLGVSRLVAVGADTRALYEAARLEGMTAEEAVIVGDAGEAAALLLRELATGDVVLVKASRSAALERLAFEIGAPRTGMEAPE
jgi:UDP-N-acetylmuramoyl-tripeptide--D-alanyl-D-alanine ligase